MLIAFCGKIAGETGLISLGLLNGPDKSALGCLTYLNVVLPGDFLDIGDFHFVFSFSVFSPFEV